MFVSMSVKSYSVLRIGTLPTLKEGFVRSAEFYMDVRMDMVIVTSLAGLHTVFGGGELSNTR